MRTRNCIVVDGKVYCEDRNLSKHDAALIGGIGLLWTILFIIAWWADDRYVLPFSPVMALLGLSVVGLMLGMVIWGLT